MKKSKNAIRFEANAKKRQNCWHYILDCIDPNFRPSDNRIRWVSNASIPPQPGFVRAWFNDGIDGNSGFRDIPDDLVEAAKSYIYAELDKDGWAMGLVQEYKF